MKGKHKLVLIQLEVKDCLENFLHVHLTRTLQPLRKKPAFHAIEILLIEMLLDFLGQFDRHAHSHSLQRKIDIILSLIGKIIILVTLGDVMQQQLLALQEGKVKIFSIHADFQWC